MIKEYDELEREISKVATSDMTKAKELSNKKKDLLKRMSQSEIEVLLSRPYPPQYKALIKKYL